MDLIRPPPTKDISDAVLQVECSPLDIRLLFAYYVIVKVDSPALSKPVP